MLPEQGAEQLGQHTKEPISFAASEDAVRNLMDFANTPVGIAGADGVFYPGLTLRTVWVEYGTGRITPERPTAGQWFRAVVFS